MNRVPQIDVRRALRKEVGFGCPVKGCGSPYLTWHHFDPPWNEREHHEPAGMIALCREHHDKADAGAYNKEQLRELKNNSNTKIIGRFDWMRNCILAVVGGNFYYETPIIFQFRQQPAIWFNRDSEGYFLLNIKMLSIVREPRLCVEDNFWIETGNPVDLESPPSGKLLKVEYANGDKIRIEFMELNSIEDIIKRYPDSSPNSWGIQFPITAVEIQEKVGGTEFEFGPRYSKLPGNNIFKNCFFRSCSVGLSIE